MANLSQIKRDQMISFLEKLKEQHSDDESLIAFNQIEKELTSKKFGLVWEEHEEDIDMMMKSHVPVFVEEVDSEVVGNAKDKKFNFLLEGDNLHSLRLLEKTHKGRISVIYIDPPYNKDKDFIYNDSIVDKLDSYKHSKWVSFMYKRLEIAHKLLTREGCIFISCDDNELHTLRMICDEIFGESNFEGHIHWRRRHNQPNDKTKLIGLVAEHIVVYSKDSEYHKTFGVGKVESTGSFSNPDNDPRGPWTSNPWKAARGRGGCKYTIITPTGRELSETWYGTKESFDSLINENRVHWPKNGDGIPRIKIYAYEVQEEGQCATNWWTNELFGCNQDATDELKAIFGGECPFDNPKPTKLIEAIIRLGSISKDAIILDFFAGSGSTGHAVMNLNKKDGGNRQFILCTNNENNICDSITYPRLVSCITGKDVNGNNIDTNYCENLKYYKTDFIDKSDEELCMKLLDRNTEMIQLQYGEKLDGDRFIIIHDEEEMDAFEKNFRKSNDLVAVFINQDILLTLSQEKLLSNIKTFIVPNYYFDDVLREAGEIW